MAKTIKAQPFSGEIKERDLDFWIEKNYNVLMIGRHGVGKTHMIKDAFERNKIPWIYFSASTMDPWTDFVGVPKEKKTDDGNSYLEFILPKNMAEGKVEAIFFDEFNRAPKKVRNAVMELLQFKSINGRKFPNLKVIWAAINPEDDDDLDFDVEILDPAQKDRFEVQIEIPYKPSLSYFQKKYGLESGKAAVEWWEGLSEELKRYVSPRRLDYALRVFEDMGSLRYILPSNAPVGKLQSALQHGSPEETIKKFILSDDKEKARRWLAHENNVEGIKTLITDDKLVMSFVLPLLGAEKITALMAKNKSIKEEITQNPLKYKDIILDVSRGSQNKKIKKEFSNIADIINNNTLSEEEMNSIAHVMVKPEQKLPENFSNLEQQHLQINMKFKENYDINKKDLEGQDIDAIIRKTAHSTFNANNTYFKSQIYESLNLISSDKLTADQSKALLKIINFLASGSQSESLSRFELPIIFNTCVDCILRENPSFSMNDLFDITPYMFYRYFCKNIEKFPTNKSTLMIELKPKTQWQEIKDEELEGINI